MSQGRLLGGRGGADLPFAEISGIQNVESWDAFWPEKKSAKNDGNNEFLFPPVVRDAENLHFYVKFPDLMC